MPSLPNILWIQTDEQRPDSLGCYGSTWAKTPNIDALAAWGTVMQNAVCQSPVCLPSRSSQLSARYPQEFGCLNNMIRAAGETFPVGCITFPEVFRQSGYETVNFGRSHAMSDDVWAKNVRTADYLPQYCNHFGLNEAYDEEAYHVLHRPNPDYRPLIIAGTYPGTENPCQLSTDRAMAYLRDRGEDAPPFLLRVSYNWPHTPTLAPPPYDQLYDPDDLPIRFYDRTAREGRARFDQKYAELHRMQDLTRDQVRQVWKDYMGLCAYVDHETGRLLRTVDELELRDNTIIFYSSDHGKLLGEWGGGEKGTFDCQVWRVPFIWSWPERIPQGQVVEAPCELIDTGRTLCGLAGLEEQIPMPWRGRDLFEGEEPAGAVFGVIRSPIQDDPGFDPRMMRAAVRTLRYRLDADWFIDGRQVPEAMQDGNLYDLEIDPGELHNLWTNPARAEVRRELMHRIDAWLASLEVDPRLLDPGNAGHLF
jgi:choline-sulfatase